MPETGVRKLSTNLRYQRAYDEGAVQRVDYYFSLDRGRSEEGDRDSVWFEHDRYWRSGWSAWLGGSNGERDGFDEADYYAGFRWNRNDMYHSGKADHMWGEHYGYPYRYQRVTQAFHPSEHWSAELRAERVYGADLDDEGNVVPPEWSHQLMFTSSYDISDERTISARLVRGGSAESLNST